MAKEFTVDIDVDGNVTVEDEVYSSAWNGSFEVPTKNALWDIIDTLATSSTVYWDRTGTTTHLVNSTDKVGIGISTALAELHIESSDGECNFRLSEGEGGYTEITQLQDAVSNINKVAVSGQSIIDISPISSTNSDSSKVRFFRNSITTTGEASVEILVPNSSNPNIYLSALDDTYLNSTNGMVAIGHSTPNRMLDVEGAFRIATANVQSGYDKVLVWDSSTGYVDYILKSALIDDTNSYVSDVTLNGETLEFTGTGAGAFNSDVDLSSIIVDYSLSNSGALSTATLTLTKTPGTDDDIDFVSSGDITISGVTPGTISFIVPSFTASQGITRSGSNFQHNTSGAASLDTSTAQVIDLLTIDTWGHVTAATTRNLTPADIGASSTSHTHTLAGDVAGDISSTVIQAQAVEATMLNDAVISGHAAATALESTDTFLLDDDSENDLRNVTLGSLETYMQDNLSFSTTDTNTTYDLDVEVSANPNLTLDASSGTDTDVQFVGTGATTVTGTAGTITISSTDTNTTYTASNGLFMSGTDVRHIDGSSVVDVTTSGANIISSLTFDTYGHVTARTTRALTAANVGAVPTTRDIIAGAGLTGGGVLSANRTFDVGAGTGITVNPDNVALNASTIASLLLADSSVQPADLLWDRTGTTTHLVNTTDKVGIGIDTALAELHVQSTDGECNLRLSEDGGASDYFEMMNINASTARFLKVTDSGNSLIDFVPSPVDGSGTAKARFFRTTNTTGQAALDIHLGNNTSAVNTRLAGNDDSFINANNGDVSIGKTGNNGATLDIGGNLMIDTVDNASGSERTVLMYEGTEVVKAELSDVAISGDSGDLDFPPIYGFASEDGNNGSYTQIPFSDSVNASISGGDFVAPSTGLYKISMMSYQTNVATYDFDFRITHDSNDLDFTDMTPNGYQAAMTWVLNVTTPGTIRLWYRIVGTGGAPTDVSVQGVIEKIAG